MLESLTVKNFALITDLRFQPQEGLNVITGETGAGKSILLGALGLVLGNRAEIQALLNKDEKCIVEAKFRIANLNLQEFFRQNDLDYDDGLIVRREITPTGKSRAFINDTPVQLNTLRELGDALIEIHTQNTGLLVAQAATQLQILDDFAGHSELLPQYNHAWTKWRSLEKELEELSSNIAALEREKDFAQFQFDELEQFKPQPSEEITLEEQISTLTHAGTIADACLGAAYALTEADDAALNKLAHIRSSLKQAAGVNKQVEALLHRLDSSLTELKEIAADLQQTGEKIENDPEKLEVLNQRLARLQNLLKKHNVNDAASLLLVQQELENKLIQTYQQGEMLEHLQQQCSLALEECKTLAGQLHKSREQASAKLCRETEKLLQDLEMPNAKLEIALDFDDAKPGKSGGDSIKMLFSANLGRRLSSLDKVASGGELSRLNFCFKTLLADKKALPTLIFDEADTGVSGEVATKMGEMMKKLSAHHQVISITHLPQVAAAGKTHFFVFKTVEKEGANTAIKQLDKAERVTAIAQMLSGKEPGEAALANARELLKS